MHKVNETCTNLKRILSLPCDELSKGVRKIDILIFWFSAQIRRSSTNLIKNLEALMRTDSHAQSNKIIFKKATIRKQSCTVGLFWNINFGSMGWNKIGCTLQWSENGKMWRNFQIK